MVTMAMGCVISAPWPTAIAMVDMARMVVRAVIRTGRMRVRPVRTIASKRGMPSSRSWLMVSTNTIPLFTTTPASTRKPSMAMMESSLPVISSASRPPVKASGMVNMTMNGESRLWNCATMMR